LIIIYYNISMKDIEEFVNKLIEDKGFNEQDSDILAQIKSDLMNRVENRINAMIISTLNSEKLSQFEKVLDSDSKEEIQNFVKNNIPDINQKVASELLIFKNMYLG